ncbi:unnamed protein product [Blepharisma stoltei]|uniref:Leucine-rich repeat-containing protein 23 n=1 Tax=Blepharisma stoltei TaxID=1481888 RepID=A0AAU9JN35_9CILI|nr:unnamed protein product [Blepharisma stoltei]
MSDSEDEPTSKVLNFEVIKRGLLQVGRTFDGTSYAFLKLELENREIETISEDLSQYQHLRYIKLSGNRLQNIDVISKIPNVLRLDLKGNRVNNLEVFNNEETFHYLQFLDLSNNNVKNLSSIKVPKILSLNLSKNEISNVSDFQGHANLKVLELRGNKISSLIGLKGMPNLQELYLAQNNINSLEGLEDLPSLKKLHLRKNKIQALEEEKIPDLPELEYLNLRENEVLDIKQLGLLKKLEKLKKLNLIDCPLNAEPSGNAKKEILIVLPKIDFVNKEEVTQDDREEAYNEAQERFIAAENARKEAERLAEEAAEREREKEQE